ncbi:MAG TPA: hypothetical protein DD671_07270 [Balneolaceae bacterium]|nr:hypothetical protein [Balneolaceae bacterium]
MSNKEIGYPFTAYPNYSIDKIMPVIDGNTFKVLTVIVRKTIGFHKKHDKIALSQFEGLTGLSRNTIIKSLKILCDNQIIEKNDKGIINKYRIILPPAENAENHLKKSANKSVSSTSEPLSSNTEQAKVHMLNPSPVQNLNTQKKPIKEIEINTTTKEGDVGSVIQAWNSRFEFPIRLSDDKMMSYIYDALKELSSQEIIQAMDNRLKANYYREQKPELLHRPSCFFPYPSTIRSDLQRVPDNLYTHDQYVKLITENNYHGDDFIIRKEQQGDKVKLMWELKRNASGT